MPTKGESMLSVTDEAPEEAVDDKLVDEAVKHIKTTLEETAFRGAIKIGNYIFETFFDGNVESLKSRNPNKSASFRKLAEKCGTQELPVSKSFLNNAVGVAVMCKELPGDGSYKKLPPSHQAALLPLHEPTTVEEFAEKAVKNEWTVRALKDAVQEKRGKHKGAGPSRPRTPDIVKTLDQSLELYTLHDGRAFTKAQLNDLTEDDAKRARKIAAQLIESLEDLVKQLKKK